MDIAVFVTAATIRVRHVTLVTRCPARMALAGRRGPHDAKTRCSCRSGHTEIPRSFHRRVARAQGAVGRGRMQQRTPTEGVG